MATTKTVTRPKKAKAPKRKPSTNDIEVKVGAFPGGQVKEYSLPVGSKMPAAFKVSGYDKIDASFDVRLNGQKVSSFDIVLNDGDQILIFSKVRGN